MIYHNKHCIKSFEFELDSKSKFISFTGQLQIPKLNYKKVRMYKESVRDTMLVFNNNYIKY